MSVLIPEGAVYASVRIDEGCGDTAVGCVTLQPSFLRFPDYYLALLAPDGVRALG